MTDSPETSRNDVLRALPQVDAVLALCEADPACAGFRRDVLKRLAQREIAALREALLAERTGVACDAAHVAQGIAATLQRLATPQLKPVVNATGIVLHTNLGRAVLSPRAQAALQEVSRGYCNVELDLATGRRSHRDVHLEPLLQALTGCEAGTVVNNNAAAVFLTLNTLAAGGEVLTSRGELIEIGGSFRIPDIMRSARCKLVEVGTTNRTRLSDFEQAISLKTRLLLKTHPSNYRVRGFCEETPLADLCALGQQAYVPVYYDIGSGYLAQPGAALLPEPDVATALATGADVVSFSGDKLLGGPQAGIIVGRRELVERIRSNPLWRMVRIDKFTAAALEATLAEYLLAPAESAAPVPDWVAQELAQAIRQTQPSWTVSVTAAEGYYGGGSLPDESLPSAAVMLSHPTLTPEQLDKRLRHCTPPVVGYIQQGAVALNILSLLPGDIERIAQALAGLPVD